MTATPIKPIFEALDSAYEEVESFLNFKTPFQLAVAVLLSAQCTDERVNLVTPHLFKAFPDPKTMADANLDDIKTKIRSVNYFNNKAANIKALSAMLLTDFSGQVPNTIDELVKLPGIGRKSANVIISLVFKQPGITVDTHVKRTTKRLGFHNLDDPVKIEMTLRQRWPAKIWNRFCTVLIMHGRQICHARKPNCSACMISSYCPSSAV